MAFLRAFFRALLCHSDAEASYGYRPIEASSLQISDVKRMLGLRRTVFNTRDPWRLKREDLLDIPERISENLDAISRTVNPSTTPVTWDTRMRLNVFIVDAVVAEQRLAMASLSPAPQDEYPVFATFRGSFSDTVRFRGNIQILQMKADYCVLSDENRRYLSTKFVIVAAGEEPKVAGVCQCLSYMAMVHRMRKEEGWDPVVYGCYSNGYQFTFYRIDHRSRI